MSTADYTACSVQYNRLKTRETFRNKKVIFAVSAVSYRTSKFDKFKKSFAYISMVGSEPAVDWVVMKTAPSSVTRLMSSMHVPLHAEMHGIASSINSHWAPSSSIIFSAGMSRQTVTQSRVGAVQTIIVSTPVFDYTYFTVFFRLQKT